MLNVKQEAFCLHYAKTGNAAESYKKAGYDAKTAVAIYANANRMLKNDKVQARLAELATEMASEKIASIKEIQERLTAIIRGEITDERIVVVDNGDGEVEEKVIRRVLQMKDVIKAGETLARMQGGFDTSMKVDMKPIVIKDDVEE